MLTFSVSTLARPALAAKRSNALRRVTVQASGDLDRVAAIEDEIVRQASPNRVCGSKSLPTALERSAVVASSPFLQPPLTALRLQRAQIAEQRSSIARQRAALESVQISSCALPSLQLSHLHKRAASKRHASRGVPTRSPRRMRLRASARPVFGRLLSLSLRLETDS